MQYVVVNQAGRQYDCITIKACLCYKQNADNEWIKADQSEGNNVPREPDSLSILHSERNHKSAASTIDYLSLSLLYVMLYVLNWQFQFKWLKNISIAHVIIIIKSEVSTLPIVIILCAWDVCYIIFCHLLHKHFGKTVLCFHYHWIIYDECK